MHFSFFNKKANSSETGHNEISLPMVWPYRLSANIITLAFIASVAVIIVTLRDNLIDKKVDQFLNDFYAYSAQHGWRIDDIIIQGRGKTPKEDIIRKLNFGHDDSILQVDLKDVKNKIEQLPWIRSAAVKRGFFPNILHISVTEKNIIALWQFKDKFIPIDQSGHVIEADYIPTKPILIIVGAKAPEKINQLLEVISSSPEIYARMKAAKLYAGRRWDIILDDFETGLTIKMPENDMDKAWKKFVKINKQHGLLKRKLTFIDLRYKNKLIVTVDGSVYVPDRHH